MGGSGRWRTVRAAFVRATVTAAVFVAAVVPPALTASGAMAATGPATGASPSPGCPQDLAERLRATGGAAQLVTVEAADWGTSTATVELWRRTGACWARAAGPWPSLIGANGFSDHHREGDGTTPTGIYRLGLTVYGNDPNPGYRGPYHRLVCGDWWDEDPTSASYNTFQHVPCGERPDFGGDSEALWTETSSYPSFAVVEYNTRPVIAYAGSAIFVHAEGNVPTTGCVSVRGGDLDRLLRWIQPAASPTIVMGPAPELLRF